MMPAVPAHQTKIRIILMTQSTEDRPGLDASDCVHRAPNWRSFAGD